MTENENAKSRQKTRTREAILASAARLVRTQGIGGARVADVMGAIGMTVGGFYAHFGSKEALVDEVIGHTAALMRARLGEGLERKAAADRALVVVKRYLSSAHRDAPDEGCAFPSIAGEIASTAPEHREALGDAIEAMTAALAPLVQLAGAPRDEAKTMATGLVALLVGGLTLARALGPGARSDAVLRASRSLAERLLASASR